MNTTELLEELHRQGISLTVEDGSLECRSVNPFPDSLIKRLKANKARIIELLHASDDPLPQGHPSALKWITDHQVELDRAGWTAKDLFYPKMPYGLAYLNPWKKMNMEAVLIGSNVRFTWHNDAGVQITQTCRLEPRWQIKNERR